MTRERLPDRRSNVGDSFLRGGGRVGSETDATLDDVAVLISRALQHGDELADLAKGMGRLPPDGSPSSIVGAAVDALLRLQGAAP